MFLRNKNILEYAQISVTSGRFMIFHIEGHSTVYNRPFLPADTDFVEIGLVDLFAVVEFGYVVVHSVVLPDFDPKVPAAEDFADWEDFVVVLNSFEADLEPGFVEIDSATESIVADFAIGLDLSAI